MSINFAAFLSSLKIMIEGWLGIFVVMGIIIACIYGLNRLTDYIEEKAAKKNS